MSFVKSLFSIIVKTAKFSHRFWDKTINQNVGLLIFLGSVGSRICIIASQHFGPNFFLHRQLENYHTTVIVNVKT